MGLALGLALGLATGATRPVVRPPPVRMLLTKSLPVWKRAAAVVAYPAAWVRKLVGAGIGACGWYAWVGPKLLPVLPGWRGVGFCALYTR